MKKTGLLTLAVALVLMANSLPSLAQALSVSFTTSAAFYAGSAKFPAGSYTLRQTSDDPTFYQLQNSAGTHSVIIEGRQSSKSTQGHPLVVFNTYGNVDYLEGVETSNMTSVAFETSSAEKLAAKKGAPQPHTVAGK
jgi:hypothetical protein